MSEVKLYNTLAQKKEAVRPLDGKTVRFYTCGLTVYSHPHIGNWIGYIYWDVLQRTLEASGYEVSRVQNITDVGHLTDDADEGEDKLAKGARTEQTTAWAVAEKYIKVADREAYELLGLKRPKLVRATENIEQQINFLKELVAKGFTYQIEGKGLYFDSSKLDDYGKLAELDIEGLRSGARIDDSGKRSLTDFVLWRLSPNDIDPKINWEWESPWGKGIPGWHLECSQIAKDYLGEQIDIHAGGIDHIPVHHTNEIAQSESLTGKQFSTIWIHNNHIKIDGGKMAKSLGNGYTLPDILDKGFTVDAFKLLVLSKHYQTEGNFTWEILAAAQNRLSGWLSAVDLLWQEHIAVDSSFQASDYTDNILFALQDNLDTPKAVNIIDSGFKKIEDLHFNASFIEQFAVFISKLLGIDLLRGKSDINELQKGLMAERQKARDEKDFAKSDQLRDQLLKDHKLEVRDTPNGQIWSRA